MLVEQDERPRPETSLEKLARLPPVFKEGGTVTAGLQTTLQAADAGSLVAGGALETPVDGTSPTCFLLEDVNETGLQEKNQKSQD